MRDWRWPYRLRLRLRTLFRREQVERELEEEFRYHLERRAEEEIARGHTPREAREIAIRAMEGMAQKQEECRDARGTRPLEDLLQDLAYAVRGLGRNRAFAAVSVLTLALGMGASIAILTVVNALILRPLPFPDPGRLVALSATTPSRNRDSTSFPDIEDWKNQTHSFEGVAAYRSDPFNITGGGAPEPLTGLRASWELFRVVGVGPAMGRNFEQQEQRGRSAVALIGRGLWLRRFGGDPAVIGKTIVLNEVPHSVIGVLPPDFRFPAFGEPDVIVPISESSDRSRGYLFAVARLAPGVSGAAAQSELDAVAARLAQAFPQTNRGRGVRVMRLARAAAGSVRAPLLVMMGAAVCVLLIGCVNVGNLVLARGIARQREFAVRRALGAGSGRLLRQLLTESVVLSLVSAAPGSALALWGSRLLVVSLSSQSALPEAAPDARLLALALLITLVCGVLCGLPPALIASGLRAGQREHRFRSLLAIAETALTVVLLAGAGLLIKSFVLLNQTALGLEPRGVLMADMLLAKRHADAPRRDLFLNELLALLGGIPGVEQAAVHTDPPFLGGGSRETFHIEGQADPGPRQGHPMAFNIVSSGFFRAMGIAMKHGRDFGAIDTPDGAPVAIVNEAMARKFWPNGDAIGKRIRLYYDRDSAHWLSIAGIAADVRYFGRDLEPVPQVFVPFQQDPYRTLPYSEAPYVSLVLRTAGDPASLVKAMQERVWAVDRDQPILHVQTMEQALAQSLANRRSYSVLLGSFAAIALLIASAGIYGSISYAVARRTREMGIRVALGATLGHIVALVLRQAMFLTLLGISLGIAGALALTRLISGLLYGITATDASTFGCVAVLFAAVAFAASYVPARRAAGIDPAAAFRWE